MLRKMRKFLAYKTFKQIKVEHFILKTKRFDRNLIPKDNQKPHRATGFALCSVNSPLRYL